jgi:hypothetical protein
LILLFLTAGGKNQKQQYKVKISHFWTIFVQK